MSSNGHHYHDHICVFYYKQVTRQRSSQMYVTVLHAYKNMKNLRERKARSHSQCFLNWQSSKRRVSFNSSAFGGKSRPWNIKRLASAKLLVNHSRGAAPPLLPNGSLPRFATTASGKSRQLSVYAVHAKLKVYRALNYRVTISGDLSTQKSSSRLPRTL